ncbi:DDB1-and CUL4-associated factor 4-like protein 1 [Trichonephila clavata]|uniref:DDB1-and CUL4-associated factor 4-like protein 1 n=1 Tax=Trichonephila clavata TaxID=2740835 RepID=A0A8X6L571_TRICU|nr:DDB1-and CUL4-associated factor 4-like protein 1 [Trichonephila clavata]
MAEKYDIHLGKAGILNKIALREQGLIRNPIYKHDITNIKINQLPKLSEHMSFRDNLFYCQSFRTGPEGCVIGVWQFCRGSHSRTRHYSSIYVIEFVYSTACTVYPNNPLPFVSQLQMKCSLRENMMVTDTFDVQYRGKTPLLFVGNYYRGGSAAMLTFFNCEGDEYHDLEWRISSYILCCSSNNHSGRFAVGCEGGYHLGADYRLSKKYHLPDNVLALEFNDDGNLLFVSSDEQGIEICDIRDVPRKCPSRIRRSSTAFDKEPALRDSSLIVNKMKLLSDQVTLIATDIEGDMSMLDLRMRRPVLTYPEHVGFKYPRPLCLDESLDLLCAAGKDNYTRIWSLSSGHLHWADKIYGQIPPPEDPQETITHCCIIPSPRRWFIAVIENQTVIPIVPDADNII